MLDAVVDNIDTVDEKYRDLYTKKADKYELTGVKGMKTEADVFRVQTALNAERAITKELKAYKDSWGDLDPSVVRPELDKVPALQALVEAGKGKLDDAQIQAQITAAKVGMQRELDATKKVLLEKDKALENWVQKDTKRTIFDAVRKQAMDMKALPESYGSEMGGLMLLAERLFTVDPAGQVVIREGATDMVPHGTSIKDAFPEIQKNFSYMWPSSQGGGASGNTGAGTANANPFKTNDMTARNNFAVQFPDKVDAMVAAAGLPNAWTKVK